MGNQEDIFSEIKCAVFFCFGPISGPFTAHGLFKVSISLCVAFEL